MKTKGQTASAFSLVELLVVVAIIGVLASILMPSMGSARILSRRTKCLNQLREIGHAHTIYLMAERLFPPLNDDEDDGSWQFNYLIFDGEEWDNNFGPLLKSDYIVDVEQLFCPVQEHRFHSKDTEDNPWPAVDDFPTRAGYGRRYHLSGRSYTIMNSSIGLAADLVHLPAVVRSAHKTGVNAVYGDGHALWVEDPGLLTDNELGHPFDPMDNAIMEDIWDIIEGAG
jgi:prepilin-type N-terminal cleavage/methylation domain-containing protein